MSNRIWLVALLCQSSACVQVPSLAGRPCGDGDACVAGFECVAGTCHAVGGDGGFVDAGTDNDAGTVADAGDDAGMADAGVEDDAGEDAGVQSDAGDPCVGHDEDQDGIADVCDNCPHVLNAGQEDVREVPPATPDGVGDACDPRPTSGGDAIALFDAFATSDLGAWEVSGDPASVVADALVVASSSEDTRLQRDIELVVPRPIVELGIESYTDPGVMDMVGPMLGGPAGEAMYCCYMYAFLLRGVGWSSVPDAAPIVFDGTDLDASLPDPPLFITLDASAATATCAIDVTSVSLTGVSPGRQRVGIYGRSSTTRISYFLVYSLGP